MALETPEKPQLSSGFDLHVIDIALWFESLMVL